MIPAAYYPLQLNIDQYSNPKTCKRQNNINILKNNKRIKCQAPLLLMGKSKVITRRLIQNKKKKKKVYRYNILPYHIKQEIILRLRSKNNNLENLAIEYQTTRKNILRWSQFGIERKKGCGKKKLNPKAEDEVEKWVLETCQISKKKVSRAQLKSQALKIFNNPKFQASKAWLDTFIRDRELKNKQLLLLYKTNSLTTSQVQYFQTHLCQPVVKQEVDQVLPPVDINFEDYIEYWNSTTTNIDKKFLDQQLFLEDSWNYEGKPLFDSQFQSREEYLI